MPAPVDHLLALLDLEPIELNRFRGANPPIGLPRVFGGQVAAQALRAAQLTVGTDHRIHSLHSYFLRPGKPGTPILYSVTRIRDGKSFTTRDVVAIQNGEVIFDLSASFQKPEDGPEFQLPRATDVPEPDEVRRMETFARRHGAPVDTREFAPPPLDPEARRTSTRRMWIRTDGPMPDDPDLHACVIAYASDMGPVGASREGARHGGDHRDLMVASLDHSMWFHRPVRVDDWLLYDLEAVSTSGARGLARGTMHTADGVLGVSVVQEALLRPVR